MKKYLFILFFLFEFLLKSWGINPQQNFESGVKSYDNGEYKDALNYFRSSLKEDEISFSVSYNIGNCYYRLGEIPSARLWYERALRIEPNNDDVLHNIRLLDNEYIKDKTELEENSILTWVRSLVSHFSVGSWKTMTFIFLGLAFLILILLRMNLLKGSRGVFLLLSFLLFGLGSACYLGGLTRSNHLNDRSRAIIMEREIDVLSAPSSTGSVVFVLHAGTKVELKRESGDWIEISIGGKNTGWLKMSQLEII